MTNSSPAPTNEQASNDQLAALYLRDRDTPCPSCNYNRRDSTSSVCPECNHPFTLISVGSLEHTRYIRLSKAILLITGLYALTGIIRNLLSINFIRLIANGTVAITDPTAYIIIWSISLLNNIMVFVLAILFWRKARHNEELSITKVVLPMAIVVAYVLLNWIYHMIASFF